MNDLLIIGLILTVYFSPLFYQIYVVLKKHKEENKRVLKKLMLYLKYSLSILFFCTLLIAILTHINFLDYEKPITFDRYNQISFKNFRGLELFKKSIYGNKRFAYVVTTIDTDIDDNTITIKSLFHPSRSFVYKKNTNSSELLTHEKYHFKITELFTRKAKERISKLKTFDKNKIEEIIEDIKAKERLYQKKYDYDTFHSYVYSEQKRYEKEVDSLLTLLTKYQKPKINIDEKN
ncbi:Secreted protein [Tenacibaculum sp. 190130A14a]|uniref:Secreted protein n=1 Tax=Tenacibaculum polynesiense TaxID=3137857 RepID=A0ABM9PEI2_9FLAO